MEMWGATEASTDWGAIILFIRSFSARDRPPPYVDMLACLPAGGHWIDLIDPSSPRTLFVRRFPRPFAKAAGGHPQGLRMIRDRQTSDRPHHADGRHNQDARPPPLLDGHAALQMQRRSNAGATQLAEDKRPCRSSQA